MSNFTICCNQCDFTDVGPDVKDYILEPEGLEREIGYPCTIQQYKEATANKLVIKRYGLLCLNCGTLEYYGPHDLAKDEAQHELLVAHGCYTCVSCGNHSFFPVGGKRVSLLSRIAGLFGLSTERLSTRFYPDVPRCPRCKSGKLRSVKNIIV